MLLVRVAAVVLVTPIVLGAQQPRVAVRAIAPSASLPVTPLRESGDGYTQYSGINDSLRIVIRDAAAWQSYWTTIHRPFIPAPELPDVDFTREMILLASTGTRPSAGYDIRIETVSVDSTRLVVVVRRTVPGNGCALAAVMTQPVDLARIPVTDLPVSFAERIERNDCGGQALHR